MFFYLAKPVKKELFELGSLLWNFVFPDFNTPFRFQNKFVTHGILYRRKLLVHDISTAYLKSKTGGNMFTPGYWIDRYGNI